MRMSNLHEKVELKKGPWTREEDQKLLAYIDEHGHGSWRSLPEKAGLQRCGKSCRLRWTNYLRPDIKRGKFSTQEDKTIVRLQALLGNRWSAIATHMPERTDNEIKNYWNTRLKKRLTRMGLDPMGSAKSKQAANLNHLTQWETARLEAEERLVRQSKLLSKFRKALLLPPPSPPKPRCLDVLKVWEANTNKNGFFDFTKTLDQSPISTSRDNGHSFTEKNAVSVNNNSSACGIMEEESNYGEVKGKTGNSLQPQDNNMGYVMDCDFNYIPDFIPVGDYNCYDTNYTGNSMVWDFEDKKDDWNELLNLVMSSPMQS